jgi:hypothetical protein
MSRLAKNERCPIHRSYQCCGREPAMQKPRKNPIRGPVTRIEDARIPRGYMEVCSPAELRRRKIKKLEAQKNICAICNEPIDDFNDCELDHIEPSPAGCKKDSHMDNLQATHYRCNREKGSIRNFNK